MEVPEWLTNAIIVLVVIFIIGAIVYLIAPDTYKDIFKIAEETFEIGEEQKKAEAAEKIITTTIEGFTLCIGNAAEGCSCTLDESNLPNGYIVWLKNSKNEAGEKSVLMQAFSSEGAATGSLKSVSNVNVRLAVSGSAKTKEGIEKQGIFCAERDLRIWNNNGKIRIGEETSTGEVQWFDFYNEAHSSQILKSGNSVCFLTNAVETGIAGMGATPLEDADNFNLVYEFDFPKDTRPAWAREAAGSSGWVRRSLANNMYGNPDIERGRIAAEAIRQLPACTGTDWTSYMVLWPVSPQDIISIDSCKDKPRELASSMGTNIPLSVTEDSNILSPVSKGVVTDYCSESCGSEGMSLAIYEVYDTGINWPTGRRIRISGMNEIDEKYKSKGSVSSTKITGVEVSAGEILGKASGKISYIENFPANVNMPENPQSLLPYGLVDTGEALYEEIFKNPFEERFCSLPRLPAEKYTGEGCERITSIQGCSRAVSRGSLQEMADKIPLLKNGESGRTVLSFIHDGRHYGYLYVFPRGVGAYTDEWIGINFLAEDTPRGICDKNRHCLCLCMSENDCTGGICEEIPEYGFNPATVNTAVIEGGGAREKTIFYQRLGDRLGICSSPPCI